MMITLCHEFNAALLVNPVYVSTDLFDAVTVVPVPNYHVVCSERSHNVLTDFHHIYVGLMHLGRDERFIF